VTSKGGQYPLWRGDGQEIFYLGNDRTVISVQVRETASEFRVLSTATLFKLPLPDDAQFFDVTRDGKQFLVNIRTAREQDQPLTLISNWTASL
jgi:hypothetical protein